MDNKLHIFLTWIGVMKFTLSQWLHAEQFNIFYIYIHSSVYVLNPVAHHFAVPLSFFYANPKTLPHNSVTPLLPSDLLSQFHFQMYSYSWCFTFI